MKALLLSGGSGTRLRPLTHTSAKQLIPVANKPVLFYAIEDLVECGITDIGIIVGHTKDEVMAAVGDGSKFGAKITFIEQDAPRGLAHTVLIAEDFIKDEPFVMYLGDNLLRGGIKKFVDEFKSSKNDAGILLTKVKDPQRFGVAELDENGKVLGLEEKPKQPKSDLALVGIYMFTKSIFEPVKNIKPSWRNELEITDAIQYLLDHGKTVSAHVVKDWFKDTGKPEDILEANHLILEELKAENNGTIEEDVSIRGRVSIGKGTIIKSGCTLRGPITIGENCKINSNSYIGPYTSIGNNTTISRVEIESSVIIGDCEINCNKRITDSLIGRYCKITSVKETLPKSNKLVLGEHSQISI